MTNSSTASDSFTIKCEDLVIEYSVSEYRSTSLKETLISKFRKGSKKEKFRALKGVTLDVKKGECLALIGHNGSGKSTMLKAMAGILVPTKGKMQRFGSCVPLIELGAGFDPELTGRENIFLCLGLLGLSRKQIESLVPAVLSFSELGAHIDMPVKTYSSGMYMRLGFACSVCVKADILLIDEILSVGDENFQRKCVVRMREIRKSGSTMVLVSHDLGQIEQLADRVIVFDQGNMVFEGHPKEAIEFYHEIMDQKRLALLPTAERDEELRKRELKRNALAGLGRRAKLRAGEIVGNNLGGLISGEKCAIRIDFDILAEFEKNICVGFAVFTSKTDARIFGGNTNLIALQNTIQMQKPGRYRIEFEIPSLSLAAGEYRLITALHNSTLTETLDINGMTQKFYVGNSSQRANFDEDILDFNVAVKDVNLIHLS